MRFRSIECYGIKSKSQSAVKIADMNRSQFRGILIFASVIMLGCLVPILGWADQGVTNAAKAAEAAKNRMVAACTAQNQTEADRQLAIVLQILATNQTAKALLAEPSGSAQRSVLLSGYSAVQKNETMRTCFFKMMDALYGAEDAQRVIAAMTKLRGNRPGSPERKAVADQIRKEFKATGRWPELKQKWQCLTTCHVFQLKMQDGQQAWVWGSVSPETTRLIFENE